MIYIPTQGSVGFHIS